MVMIQAYKEKADFGKFEKADEKANVTSFDSFGMSDFLQS